ncbi:DnaJ domain protein, partial [Ostertagia ostertagi]
KDYYQVLGVERDATQRQIKNAYYTLSKKASSFMLQITYHPDVAGRNAGTESKFIEITEAYECLKDPERRRIYDGDSQHFGQRRENPFYSKRYTQQEYERLMHSDGCCRYGAVKFKEIARRKRRRMNAQNEARRRKVVGTVRQGTCHAMAAIPF